MKIQMVIGEDWQGIYINNLLEDDGHSLSTYQVVKIITDYINQCGIEDGISFVAYEINQEWMEKNGELPKNFEDIPAEFLKFYLEIK